jgi:uncharacterized protein YcbX
MRVAEIWRYPVKSMGGERLADAVVGESGIEGDRQWGVLDQATGLILTARREPRLLFAAARLEEGSPVLEGPDGTPLPGDDELTGWLGRPVTLVSAAGRIGTYEASVDRYLDDADWVTWEGPLGAFHDSGRTQVSLVARESLHAWDRRRFRFNLVLEGGSELSLLDATVQVGAARLHVGKRISRCVMTTRAQPDGIERDVNVLRTIVADLGGCLGVGAVVIDPGAIAVGDVVTADG